MRRLDSVAFDGSFGVADPVRPRPDVDGRVVEHAAHLEREREMRGLHAGAAVDPDAFVTGDATRGEARGEVVARELRIFCLKA